MAAKNFASLAGIGATVPPNINLAITRYVATDNAWSMILSNTEAAYKMTIPSLPFDYYLSFSLLEVPPNAFLVPANSGPFVIESPAQAAPMSTFVYMFQHSGADQGVYIMTVDKS